MAPLNWRPDLYRHHKCESCGIQAATVGTLCATCDHERWQHERNGNGTQPPRSTAPVLQWNRDAGMYLQISGTPVPEYVQLADYLDSQEQAEASQDAADLRAWATGR